MYREFCIASKVFLLFVDCISCASASKALLRHKDPRERKEEEGGTPRIKAVLE